MPWGNQWVDIYSERNNVKFRKDIQDMLALESEKQLLGCSDDTNCLAEIGGALGVSYLVAGNIGKNIGYLLVDELISVSSRHSTDERQHSVCTYVFNKNGSQWKIKQEHCSSLPDYSIVPGDDALYYFHNPVY